MGNFSRLAVALAAAVVAALGSFAQNVNPLLTAAVLTAPVSAGHGTLFSSSRSGLDLASGADPFDAAAIPGIAGAAITRGQPAPAGIEENPLSRIALGAYTSPLGAGVGAAARVVRRANVRVGWNFFNYSLTGTDDGATYSGNLHFRSLQASVDLFPFRGSFHVSPGFLFHNQNRVIAGGGIAGGTSFTLNDVNYYSSNADPVSGSGSIHFNSTAPMLTVGWGNWVSPREHRHLSFPFEIGFAHTGDAAVALHLKGTVCSAPDDMYCSQIATDPSVQANIHGQIGKLQKDLQWIRFYPIISGGVAYKF